MENTKQKFNLNRLKELAGDRMEWLCNPDVSKAEKKSEHYITEDFCLLATQFLKANDQQIRLRRLRFDEESLGKSLDTKNESSEA
jgi:hypothetical protein